MTFEEALALKREVEQDQRFRVVVIRERSFTRGAEWRVGVTFQHIKNDKPRYTRISSFVDNRSQWLNFVRRAAEHVQRNDARYPVK